jgi:hypothetical protein
MPVWSDCNGDTAISQDREVWAEPVGAASQPGAAPALLDQAPS